MKSFFGCFGVRSLASITLLALAFPTAAPGQQIGRAHV